MSLQYIQVLPVLENMKISFVDIALRELIQGIKNIRLLKVTAGSTPEIGDLYASIITAGTHLAPTIKVIENSQRDIAFVNELAIIFNKLDTNAAGTSYHLSQVTV